MAGQGEEDVVEGRLVDLDVVDGDARLVQGPDHRGSQAGAVAAPRRRSRRPSSLTATGPVDVWFEGADRAGGGRRSG